MKKYIPIKKVMKKTAASLAILIMLSCFLLISYSVYLSFSIEKRFSDRRWQIPSKVYSDITLLYPGLKINPTLFYQKIHNLNYRRVTHNPEKQGEIHFTPSGFDIYLKDFLLPGQFRKGFPASFIIEENRILSITGLESGETLPLLELEPEEIMLFFGPEREKRQIVSIEQIPHFLADAVLAAEDRRFYQHHGIDPRGILRAFITNLRHGEIRQGGSTLTQQLAKNYFLTPERTYTRKLKELILSVIIEIQYEKPEILEIYLNEIYLGQKGSISINGVGEASYFYFGKPVAELTRAEAATIAGLIRAPNAYSPYIDPDRCKERRNSVLTVMHEKGWISKSQLETALSENLSPVGYFVSGKKAPYFIDYLSGQTGDLYDTEALSSLGLSFYTTMDTQVQTAAEQALERGLSRLETANPSLLREASDKRLQGAIIVMQPQTGHILAMVGGRNYSESQFNRATQAKRQPGSVFKPFVYLAALDGFSPASMLSNEPKAYEVDGKVWDPQNFEEDAETVVNMRTALTKSYNLATIDLALKTGLDKIVAEAAGFGFSTPLKPYPSLALGAYEVIPIELATAYCAFAADGMLPFPLSLTDVLDENDNAIERRHTNIEQVTSPEKVFIMNSMLQSVATEGTARSLSGWGITWPVAGKTGTTNNTRDAWFVGYTPNLLALVWVGFDNGDPIHATGAGAALPIWADLMNAIPQYQTGEWFRQPRGIVKKIICTESGQLAESRKCPEQKEEFFLENNVPDKYCELHGKQGAINKMIKGIKDLIQTD
ncbi:MAG: PBP1A family penicillin-binding protein [Desulfobacterales bacterium]|nr:PBP1A family penicillin-binding protein [Desulfobacterales bacterium]